MSTELEGREEIGEIMHEGAQGLYEYTTGNKAPDTDLLDIMDDTLDSFRAKLKRCGVDEPAALSLALVTRQDSEDAKVTLVNNYSLPGMVALWVTLGQEIGKVVAEDGMDCLPPHIQDIVGDLAENF